MHCTKSSEQDWL